MNERGRFIATLTFGQPDRIPFSPGGGRESTLQAWHRQGLPPEVNDPEAHVRRVIGIAPPEPGPRIGPDVDFRMIPHFEEKVLERRPGTLVVQDWKGNVCEISDRYDVRYLREAIDFVTRSWIRCPVESRADWTDMARRYDVADPGRYPADYADRCARLRERAYVSGLVFPGPFWQLREWVGFEGLCMLFLDDPAFVREMVDFWQQFVAAMLEQTFRDHVPDYVMINEDMAYKEKSMISPAMCRQFLVPSWRRWGDLCRDAGVPVYCVDSDGYIADLIPVWIEGGFQATSPVEVAAGNDLPAFRAQFGRQMAYEGGVDKRAMAAGGRDLRDEIDRLRPAIEAGGYIPGCDHGIPPDVSWPNFVEYCRLLAEVTGWSS